MTRVRPQAGFTLVEVLVAMFIMALLAVLSWQGLDGILRARDGTREVLDRTVRLNTVVAQWEQDLAALHDAAVVPALAFDGQTLRLTRRAEGGVMLVAWSVRGGVWQRWAGPTYTRVIELQEGWLRSQQLLGSEAGHLTVADGASSWQVYFHRGEAWTNAQSSGDIALPPAPSGSAPLATTSSEVLPNAVRLVITLDGHTFTRDVALGPAG